MNVFGITELKNPVKEKIEFKEPFELFKSIYSEYDSSFLLESMESDTGLARYSFIGFEPRMIIRARSGFIEVEHEGSREEFDTENPFEFLRQFTRPTGKSRGFCGGLVGYISYQAARFFDRINLSPGNFPDFEFGLFLDGIMFNHLTGECSYISLKENRLPEISELLREETPTGHLKYRSMGTLFSRRRYLGMVEEARERIAEGEIFQAVLSNATDYRLRGDRLALYEALRRVNPSPYMYHLKLGSREITGSSPEMLVRVEDKQIETFPIAGTRPRGKTTHEDERIAAELLSDEKELAEHLMLVDLARNDLGRISEFGTVQVPEYMTIRRFSHVQHILSHVTGRLRKGMDALDALGAVFPAGTVSGAPKIRAMEIIESLEGVPRNAYAGALGYLSLNGNADFAITIRSMVAEGSYGRIQAGAGIVHDSVPEREYVECQNKAMAVLKSMELAGEGFDSDEPHLSPGGNGRDPDN